MNRTTKTPLRRSGFTLVEVLIATAVLLVVIAALVGVFLVSSSRATQNDGNVVFSVAARNITARLRADEFLSLTAEFPTSFQCTQDGTISFSNTSNALVTGSIEFFNDENSIPSEFGDLGGSFDLNANGTIDLTPVTDYVILPTRIRLSLTDPSDPRSVTLHLLLSDQ